MPLTLHSPAVEEGGTIPRKYSCDGDDVSPPLSWSEAPDETESLVLIMDDPDAPGGTWVHWVVYDIPSTAEGFDEDVPPRTVLSAGGTHGENSWGKLGYGGPCPPDGTHRYVFKLYALDTRLGLDPGVRKPRVLDAMEDHVVERTRITAEYTSAE